MHISGRGKFARLDALLLLLSRGCPPGVYGKPGSTLTPRSLCDDDDHRHVIIYKVTAIVSKVRVSYM